MTSTMKKIMTQKEASLYMQAANARRSEQRILISEWSTNAEKEESKAALIEIEQAIKELMAPADAALSEVQKRCTAGLFSDADTIFCVARHAALDWLEFFPAKILAGSIIEICARNVDCNAYRKKGLPMTTWARLEIQKNGALLIKALWRGDATRKSTLEPSPACADWIMNSRHHL